MKRILLLASFILCGCTQKYPQWPNSHTTQVTASDSLQTFEHDGHKWVIANGHQCIALVHHPDCPCLNREKEENAK